MSQPFWTCDTCGEPILRTEDGWVEWIEFHTPDGEKGRDLRLVHIRPASPTGRRCQFNQDAERLRDGGLVADVHLADFLGVDGLMELLSMLAEGRIPHDEVIEMIKRLHIPGYDQARAEFSRAIAEGVIQPNAVPGFYRQREIQAVLKYIEEGA